MILLISAWILNNYIIPGNSCQAQYLLIKEFLRIYITYLDTFSSIRINYMHKSKKFKKS